MSSFHSRRSGMVLPCLVVNYSQTGKIPVPSEAELSRNSNEPHETIMRYVKVCNQEIPQEALRLHVSQVIFSFFEVVPRALGLSSEMSHSGDYGEFPQRRPGVRGAVAVTKKSRPTGMYWTDQLWSPLVPSFLLLAGTV